MNIVGIIAIAIIIILVIGFFAYGFFFTVEQQTARVVERFGKFVRVARAGLNCKIPLIERLSGKLNLRVQQLDVPVETKTADNVFIRVAVSVQFRVLPEKLYEAFYKLENPEQQMTAFVFDVVRARVPKIKLDDVFAKKDEIAEAVKEELTEIITDLGYGIVKTLVTDLDPDAKVKKAMNEINEAQRLRVAANERGEAEKILKVKQAEAEAQSAALQGKGMADQRKALIEGLKDSVQDFHTTLTDVKPGEILNLVLLTQYFDTLKTMGDNGKSNTIMLPHSPGAVNDIANQLREAVMTANIATQQTGKSTS